MGRQRLRKASQGDREFAYQVKRATFKEYVEVVWGWDEDLGRLYSAHRDQCPQGRAKGTHPSMASRAKAGSLAYHVFYQQARDYEQRGRAILCCLPRA